MNRQIAFYSILALLLILMSCENDLKEVNRIAGTGGSSSVETSIDGVILYSDSARLKIKIEYDSLVRFNDAYDSRDVFPDGVKITFYNDSGEASNILTSKFAERFNRRNLVVATDSVNLISRNGEELLSNELLWDENKKLIFTEKFVRLTRPGEVIYSYGFKANQEFTEYEIKAISGKLKKENFEDK